ncbi:MAG: alpha/beta fold hydrolase [Syntrophales bacterium]|nr:alpha/beta fold hydrolase [Syntrophales bacterium]MDD5232702.1 alpha/beta fold hydrolase [Syntrophales bacterium]MDD5533601.1 alpha/beta fold hydrolase [Syntrophales bacterium]HPL63201.1 alpha/beta fold hydrolase [Syntrophales bacterium]
MAYEDNYVRAAGVKLRYWSAGLQGPPLVLIHGLGASAEIWKENISALSRSFRVFAPDLPGFGRSEKPDAEYSPRFLLDSVLDFMAAAGLERASLAGLSLGGGIALMCAIKHPEKVDKLVLVGSAGLGAEVGLPLRLAALLFPGGFPKIPRTVLARFMKRLVYDPSAVTGELVDTYVEYLSDPGCRTACSRVLSATVTFRGARPEVLNPILEKLDAVRRPTLIIWGRQDRVLPLRHALAAADRIPAVRLQIFENCGHMPNIEHPADFNRAVLSYLRFL